MKFLFLILAFTAMILVVQSNYIEITNNEEINDRNGNFPIPNPDEIDIDKVELLKRLIDLILREVSVISQ
jgi:hypothetical protein